MPQHSSLGSHLGTACDSLVKTTMGYKSYVAMPVPRMYFQVLNFLLYAYTCALLATGECIHAWVMAMCVVSRLAACIH